MAEESTLHESLETSIARAESQLARLLGWIAASESRLALVLPLSAAMLGALAVLVPRPSSWTVTGGIAAAFAATLLVLSVAFAAVSSFPRTKGPKGSLIYFEGIAARNLAQYKVAVKSLAADAYLDDLIDQCHRNAQIAEKKYAWVQRSMAALFLAAPPWVLSLFVLYSGPQ